MENTIIVINKNSNSTEIAKQVNKVRLSNKNNWYQITFENETTGEKTRLKIYNTWIQLTEKPVFSTGMDATPTQFKNNIQNGISKLINL
jgi:hypothetical protein